MPRRRALYGKLFSPPGLHHQQYVRALLNLRDMDSRRWFFDEALVIPCGPRPDDPKKNRVLPVHRAAMADLAFGLMPRCQVVLDDLERPEFMRTHELEAQYSANGDEVWHVVDTTDIRGGKDGTSKIQTTWQHGAELWERLRFVVIVRGEYDPDDLPPHRIAITDTGEPHWHGSSRHDRTRLLMDCDVTDHVDPHVAAYIERHQLYHGAHPLNPVPLQLDLGRPVIYLGDEKYVSGRARGFTHALGYPISGEALSYPASDVDRPSCILVFGGDGTMMRAIRQHWRLRVPFFGVNTGHLGFHLNEVPEGADLKKLLQGPLKAFRLPMLHVSYENILGTHEAYAYQDAWVRAPESMISIAVHANERELYSRLLADVALVATPVGTTGYADSLYATGIPFDQNPDGLLTFAVGGFNRHSTPNHYRSENFPPTAKISFRGLETGRRPMKGYVDGVGVGEVERMDIRISRAAAVEVAYFPDYDPSEKMR